MVISLVHLGRMSYRQALAVQEQVCAWRKTRPDGDALLLVEHPPVLTLGRNARREHVLADERLLAARGIEVLEVNRGGDVTYHGPGQLVGYPILDLRGFVPRLGILEYMRRLEEVLIRACGGYGVLAQRVAGRTGVWTVPGERTGQQNEGKKIAALGVHISRGVTSHGFALNVTTDLRDFQLIVPCGIADRGVTSLEEEIGPARPMPSFEEVGHSVARQFGRVFDRQILHLQSLQDLVRDNPVGCPGVSAAAAGN